MSKFQIKKHYTWRDEAGAWTDDRRETGQWMVFLPHQCDSWEIAGGNGDGYDHAEAVKELEAFLDEGKQALAALKAKVEFGDEEYDE